MSIISNSFKKNAASRLAKAMNIEDEEQKKCVLEAYSKGFELAESLFTEQE